jgi:hypothetical protein
MMLHHVTGLMSWHGHNLQALNNKHPVVFRQFTFEHDGSAGTGCTLQYALKLKAKSVKMKRS